MKKVLCISLCILTLLAAWTIGPDVSAVPRTLRADAAETDSVNAAGSSYDLSDTGDTVITGIVGDADRDMTVTIFDATRIQRCLALLYFDESGMVAAFGDVDGDGLNILDATAIQRHLAGIPTGHPIGQEISVSIFEEDPTEPTDDEPDIPGSDYKLNGFESRVVSLVNQVRTSYGLNELTADLSLSQIARMKAQDMHDNGYFDHISPTYGSAFDMMDAYGISYTYAGENIAAGYRSPEAVVNGWMNSKAHRDNILNSKYTKIGMGYVDSGYYWAQMFIG